MGEAGSVSALLLGAAAPGLETEIEAAASEPWYQLPGCDQGHQLLGFQLLQTSSPGAILRNFAFDQGACGVKPVFSISVLDPKQVQLVVQSLKTYYCIYPQSVQK